MDQAWKMRPLYIFRQAFLCLKKDIDYIFKNSDKRTGTTHFTLIIKKATEDSKLCIMITRKVGKAHDRNKLRRRIKHIFYNRLRSQAADEHSKMVLMAKPGACKLDFTALLKEMQQLNLA